MKQFETSSMGVDREFAAVNQRTNALIAVSNAYSRTGSFQNALYVTMHNTPSFGSAIANIATNDLRNTLKLSLPRTDVAEAIRSETHSRMFDLIVAAFELHHVSPLEAQAVCEAIGKAMSPSGTFVIADYSLPPIQPAEYEPYIVGASERKNVEQYGGVHPWFHAHSGLNREKMLRMSLASNKAHAMSESLPGHGAIAVATGDEQIIAATKAALMPYMKH